MFLLASNVKFVFAQTDFKQDIANIKYKYLELAEFPNYLKKSTFISEVDLENNKSYIVGELFGYYNKSKLCIIKEHTKHDLGRRTREFYLYEGKLIFVYEQIQALKSDTFSNGEIRKKPSVIFSCSYYIKDDRFIQKISKGHSSPYPPNFSNGKLKEQFLLLVIQYGKKLSEIK
jgi:hypothetical protein